MIELGVYAHYYASILEIQYLIPQKHRKGHHVVYNPLFDSLVFGFSLLTALQLELQEISAILPVLNHSDVLNLFISQKSMFLVLTRKE